MVTGEGGIGAESPLTVAVDLLFEIHFFQLMRHLIP
mgnify:CR=1 FL=1